MDLTLKHNPLLYSDILVRHETRPDTALGALKQIFKSRCYGPTNEWTDQWTD